MIDITETLKDRGAQYGRFETHAEVAQKLKRVVQQHEGYKRLSDDKREAIDMIFHKIGRVINGNPNNHDSWHDIVGYAKLVADTLLTNKETNHDR